MLTRKHLHDMTSPHRNVYFLSALLMCLLCPSQPSLSHWDLKLQWQQRHSPHLIFLLRSHSQTKGSYHRQDQNIFS